MKLRRFAYYTKNSHHIVHTFSTGTYQKFQYDLLFLKILWTFKIFEYEYDFKEERITLIEMDPMYFLCEKKLFKFFKTNK